MWNLTNLDIIWNESRTTSFPRDSYKCNPIVGYMYSDTYFRSILIEAKCETYKIASVTIYFRVTYIDVDQEFV